MKIDIKIDKQGKAIVDVDGMVGASCDVATQSILEKLGVVTSDVKKPEYYQQGSEGQDAYQG